MTRKILHRALRISRSLALVIGAVVISAVVLGAATTALAAAPGDPLRLGKVNAVNNFTKLVGKAPSPRLVVDNNGSGTALSLQVGPGKPPMQVNSSKKVARLNADRLDNLDQSAFLRENGKAADADKLDGKDSGDFLPTSTYTRSRSTTGSGGANTFSTAHLSCNTGDELLSGGYFSVDEGTHVESSIPSIALGEKSWFMQWKNNATVDTVGIQIRCAYTTP